ncbi:two-component system response regulator [Psychromonas marina]|uniref:Two-component system response regulator n=1 Tax=Psychromonas marina TaxID=88364 RepID=A0ABQ6E0H7_9GAMM|nr:ANTAR domain-containing protein [Psychromonas marina]GLS90759.1 two-component system response regulator [Psychromonas marina]
MTTKKIMRLKPQQALSVLLVEDVIDKYSELKMAILKLNHHISDTLNCGEKLAKKCAQIMPKILIIHTNSVDSYLLKELAKIDQLSPLPVIIFATQETPSLIQSAVKVGVSTYIINGFETQRLASVITVAQERFKDRQLLRNELQQTKIQLANRKIVERAKGFVMQQKNISEQEAFNMLRKIAMNNGHSLATVAKNVIEVSELLHE